MSNNKNISKHKIKYCYILLLSIILCPLLIINSNRELEKRRKEQLAKESEGAIQQRFFGRYLLTFDEGVEKICKKGSEDLKNYYVSKVDETLGLDKEEKENGETPEYINSLVDVIKGTTGQSENEMTDNLMTYGKHLIAPLACLAIAILAIPGWVLCCSCCCCNCCCCCCCNKPSCKFPFFIIAIVFYILVAGICLYGLITSNSIFRGLADTECSILQFFNETISGEAKNEKPKWAGIEGIKAIIQRVKDKIDTSRDSTVSSLEAQQDNITDHKNPLETALTNSKNYIKDNANCKQIGTSGDCYRLDITIENVYGGYIDAWKTEYEGIYQNSNSYLTNAISNFNTILGTDSQVVSSLNEVKSVVESIGSSINEVKTSVSDAVVEYSDYIDEYGKLGFKVFFSALVCIDAVIAAFMILLGFCSGKICNQCCFFRCGFKILIHLFWNILALLMIVTFFISFIFTLIGTLGKDLTFVMNFFISEDNLNQEEPGLFGSEGRQLFTCFIGDGNILEGNEQINLGQMTSFENLNDLIDNLESVENDFRRLRNQDNTYKSMMRLLNERVTYTKEDFSIKSESDEKKFSDLISQLNGISYVTTHNHKWGLRYTDGTSDSTYHYYNPKVSTVTDVYTTSLDTEANSKAEEIETAKLLVKIANHQSDPTHDKDYKTLTDGINDKYQEFLDSETCAIATFKAKIREFTNIFDIGEDGGIFDFVNCKFIDSNIKVLLRNLRKGVGNTFYTVGICLLLAGLSLAIAISFTILLVVIINKSVDENKKA
jgi:hypothetical protein